MNSRSRRLDGHRLLLKGVLGEVREGSARCCTDGGLFLLTGDLCLETGARLPHLGHGISLAGRHALLPAT